jgi:metallo-beta-lactamase class B
MALRISPGRVITCVLLVVGLYLTGCQSASPLSSDAEITISEDIILRPVDRNLWVHTTYFEFPGSRRYPANGLIVLDGSQAMLVDLPWTDEQMAELCDWIAQHWRATVTTVVPTHFHEDCMGGLAEAHRRGAASYALDRTIRRAQADQLPVPQHAFTDEIALRCRKTPVVVKYFGAGHTTDNVVAWLPRQRVLFAGCLVKSLSARSLGNTRDGDLGAYPATLQRVRETYPEAKVVIPGHGAWGGPELIDHTLSLCANRQE